MGDDLNEMHVGVQQALLETIQGPPGAPSPSAPKVLKGPYDFDEVEPDDCGAWVRSVHSEPVCCAMWHLTRETGM